MLLEEQMGLTRFTYSPPKRYGHARKLIKDNTIPAVDRRIDAFLEQALPWTSRANFQSRHASAEKRDKCEEDAKDRDGHCCQATRFFSSRNQGSLLTNNVSLTMDPNRHRSGHLEGSHILGHAVRTFNMASANKVRASSQLYYRETGN